jgi:hypothetical protein
MERKREYQGYVYSCQTGEKRREETRLEGFRATGDGERLISPALYPCGSIDINKLKIWGGGGKSDNKRPRPKTSTGAPNPCYTCARPFRHLQTNEGHDAATPFSLCQQQPYNIEMFSGLVDGERVGDNVVIPSRLPQQEKSPGDHLWA